MLRSSVTYYGVAILTALSLPWVLAAQNPAGVLTGQYNQSRTSANLHETILNPSNVVPTSFGLLFTQGVDANISAQPLYVPSLKIKGATHNVVFAATLQNTVYAFDADTAQPALWSLNLGTPVPIGTSSQPTVGILGTPVIDTSLNIIFVVTFTLESGTPTYRLHAINIISGTEITSVLIRGAVKGTGDDTQGTPCTAWDNSTVAPPCIPFKAGEVFQRPALLEGTAHTTIYVAFGGLSGQETTVSYHGWVVGYAYAAGRIKQTMIFSTTTAATQTQAQGQCSNPENQCGHGSGIWMSGRGPAMDATGFYVATGNGGFGGPSSGNLGESVLRLNGSGAVQDYFTPQNYTTLNRDDLDLSSGGLILFTSSNTTAPNLVAVAGKSGTVDVLNRASLGAISSGNSGALQSFTATTRGCGTGPGEFGCYEIHSPALWERPDGQTSLYVWAQDDVLRTWDFAGSTNTFRPGVYQGAVVAPAYPGPGLAISANGNANGIIWATTPQGSGASSILYAFDANNLTTPIWSSSDYWFASKFAIPTIVNGKVYVPTSASGASAPTPYSPALRIYGLCGLCVPLSKTTP